MCVRFCSEVLQLQGQGARLLAACLAHRQLAAAAGQDAGSTAFQVLFVLNQLSLELSEVSWELQGQCAFERFQALRSRVHALCCLLVRGCAALCYRACLTYRCPESMEAAMLPSLASSAASCWRACAWQHDCANCLCQDGVRCLSIRGWG